MKILHCIGYFQPELGYEEFYTANEQSKDAQNQVYVVCSDRFAKLLFSSHKERMAGKGVTRFGKIIIVRLPTIIELHNDFLLVRGLFSIMNRIRPDVVHCHTTTQPTSLFSALYSKYLGIPYVIDSHDFFFKGHCCNPIKRNVLSFLSCIEYCTIRKALGLLSLRGASSIVSVAPSTTEHLKNFYRLTDDVISYLPLAVDSSQFKPLKIRSSELAKKLNIHYEPNKFKIGFVGNITKRKSLDKVIERLGKLDANCSVFFIGGGDEKLIRELKMVSDKLVKEAKVYFIGYRPKEELNYWFNYLDLCIWPFNNSVSCLEALASGCKILAADFQLSNSIKECGGKILSTDADMVEKIYQARCEKIETNRLTNEGFKLSYAERTKQLMLLYADAIITSNGGPVGQSKTK